MENLAGLVSSAVRPPSTVRGRSQSWEAGQEATLEVTVAGDEK